LYQRRLFQCSSGSGASMLIYLMLVLNFRLVLVDLHTPVMILAYLFELSETLLQVWGL
jgi:hypothetical protein